MILAGVALVLTYIWLVPSIHPYVIKEQEGTLVNPVLALTDGQALADFNSDYVFYLLYSAQAYHLHPAAFSQEHPRVLIILDDVMYRAEVLAGTILVSEGAYFDADLSIYSTKQEVIRLLRNPSLLSESFTSGVSYIETHASHATLFSKGYARLYDQLYDSSIARNVIRILSS